MNNIQESINKFILKNFNSYNLNEKKFKYSILNDILIKADRELMDLEDENLTYKMIITKSSKVKGQLNYSFFVWKKKEFDLMLFVTQNQGVKINPSVWKEYDYLDVFPNLCSKKVEVWISSLVYDKTDLKDVYEQNLINLKIKKNS